MMRSLMSGVAGLKAHQTRMDVIGNNIANVNTIGYKSKRTTFKDSFYQTLSSPSDATAESGGVNGTQVGYGSVLSTIDVLHTNGGLNSTGNAMDVYIQGDGYLIADDGKGKEMYTRVGILGFDGDGNLVDGNGNYILGYPMARYTDNQEAKAGTITVGSMTIDFGADNASCFNGYKIQTVTDPAATGVTAVADVNTKFITITSNGGAVDAAALQNALQNMTSVNGDLPAMVRTAKITVEGTGNLAADTVFPSSVSGGEMAHTTGSLMFETIPAESAAISINGIDFKFGADNGEFFNGYRIATVCDTEATDVSAEIDLSNKVITITSKDLTISVDDMQQALRSMSTKPGTGTLPNRVDTTLITVTGKTSTVLDSGITTTAAIGGADVSQSTILDKSNGLQRIQKCGALLDTDGDGIYDAESGATAELRGISISENGTISGEDANGMIFKVGQIVLASVANPSALNYDGDGYLIAEANVGEVTYGVPGENNVGTLVAGALENSNVDLANEFSDMIITQRGFQANSRIITVSDSMLEELVNLKR